MRYLFFLLLTGCTLSAQNENEDNRKDAEFKKLIDSVKKNHINFNSVSEKVKKKEEKIVTQAISKIATLKAEVSSLKNEIANKADTIYIHDTIQITEKKNFWGKTKVDTINNQ
jgi:hypothetical protein